MVFFLASRGNSTDVITTPIPEISISAEVVNIYIDVAGKVKKPGVYQIPQGSRAIDAINAAGGAKTGVDLSDINLAHVLVDGEQIYVGYQVGRSAIGATGKININRATQSEFDTLPGIGPVLAARIITYRNKNGLFTTVEDLQKVSGIGGAKFNDIKDRLRI
ncbi:MAG: hypothetical protein F2846_03690 [Actinobacteria bacterium]|nr:hypothetical protein [Actinomycetota bacterium]MSW16373.1 hypothetical protein [Actinomycetota bacterium]MSX44496.1 hypothetical protein [Actinomycetota bacterium]MSX85669.1 hypothetical protein [Actinomycetota bacterium]MSY23981.1 hypothetical protein [Actinomycetota bacterium]